MPLKAYILPLVLPVSLSALITESGFLNYSYSESVTICLSPI